jgi:hypothetical protein
VQRVQDVFAEISGMGAVVTDLKGEPLTRMSNQCEFCALMQSSPLGVRACQASWQEMQGEHAHFLQCYAGLQYSCAMIDLDNTPIAKIVSGQFFADEAQAAQFKENLPGLAQKYGLPLNQLQAAAQKLSILDKKYQKQLREWLEKVAATFSDVSSERARLLGRLRQIAEITLDVEGGTLSKLAR